MRLGSRTGRALYTTNVAVRKKKNMQLVCSTSNSTTETLHGHIRAKFTREPPAVGDNLLDSRKKLAPLEL